MRALRRPGRPARAYRETVGLYERHVLPRLIDVACRGGDVDRQRRAVVPRAAGRVLEVGMGPGLNLPFYDTDRVEIVWAAEPSDGMRHLAADRIAASGLDVRWLGVGAEALPLDDDSVDSVVLTYTLCSIADWETALAEMRRVLRPGGQLLFSEHGEAPDESVRSWQHRVDPIWTRVAGGCHLTRPIPQLIESAGFGIEQLDQRYLPGPKIASYHSSGWAVPA
jgi:ubiquinone/menaquinone biosynthesis C-methylase UbiE